MFVLKHEYWVAHKTEYRPSKADTEQVDLESFEHDIKLCNLSKYATIFIISTIKFFSRSNDVRPSIEVFLYLLIFKISKIDS